jgi:prepilin-type N-terminal cleavage/methylation domain-containing protein
METRNGFTLVELLLVVLILAVLASIVLPRISIAAGEADDSTDDANWANLIRALEIYAAKNSGVYPVSDAAFQTDILGSKTYFPHGSPVCPHAAAYVYDPTAGEETVTKHTSGN